MKEVLIIGAGGQMTGRTAMTLAQTISDGVAYTFADISQSALDRVSAGLPDHLVRTMILDIYDEAALDAAIAGKDFVIHGAGPYHKTAGLVRKICLKHGADYMDIDDDVESGLEAIALDAAAKEAGVGLYTGCGASPGLTNILARDLIDQVDEAIDVEVMWCVGNEDGMELGRAVAEHTLHICAGDCVTWRNGRQVTHQSFIDTVEFPIAPGHGSLRVYECAHPETVMIPFSYPHLRNVTCWGGLMPLPTVGFIKGIAQAERRGDMSTDEAVAFLQDLVAGRSGSLKGLRYAFGGALEQVRKGESSLGDLIRFLFGRLEGDDDAGIAGRVLGYKDGELVQVHRATTAHGEGDVFANMELATGLSQAAFAMQVLNGKKQMGTLFPEKWADADAFLKTLSGWLHEGETERQDLFSDYTITKISPASVGL